MELREGMSRHVRGGVLVGLCIVLSVALALMLLLAYPRGGVLSVAIACAAFALGVLGTVIAIRHY